MQNNAQKGVTMKLLFKQRFFSWFDSYDIYDEFGNTIFVVKGVMSFGHCLQIFNSNNQLVGMIKQEILTLLPRFRMYIGENCIGQIKKELTFLKPKFTLDCNDWSVEGSMMQWDYKVLDSQNQLVMTATKELFNLTDTYQIDVVKEKDILLSLMIVLAIDAAKCSD